MFGLNEAKFNQAAFGQFSKVEPVLLSIRDYVRLALPEPDVLRVLGEESERKGTNRLTTRQIDRIIKATRDRKTKR